MHSYLLVLLGSGQLIACVAIAWKAISHINREQSLKRDYPPHRHINGTRIVYPAEYQPPPIEQLQ